MTETLLSRKFAEPRRGSGLESQGGYHVDTTRDSNSSLKLFRDSIPAYHAIRIAKTREPDPASWEQTIGTALHTLALETHLFSVRYAVDYDDAVARKHKRKTAAGGRLMLTRSEAELVCGIGKALASSRLASACLQQPGACELVYTWDDPDTGLPLKMKADKVLASGLIIDLKTVAGGVDPISFAKTVASFGYHRQAALYLDGAWIADRIEGPFVFVAVSREWPHEVAVYELDADALAAGRKDNQDTLRELAERKATGNWSSRYEVDQVQLLSLPKWAL